MPYASEIKPHMDVIGSDGSRIGSVDRVDGDRIKLARGDTPDGEHHHIPLSAVSRVDEHVHVSTTGAALGIGANPAAKPSGASLPPIRNPAVASAQPRRNYYLPWVLLGIALLALLLVALDAFDGDDDDDRRQVDATAGNVVAAAPLGVEAVRLPNGRTVDVEPGSFNQSLQRFLDSDEPTPRAFAFDRLNFDSASAAIRPGEAATVETLADILKAYPRAHVRIVGYTDAEGAAASNLALGQLRAEAVAAALAGHGIGRGRVEAAAGGEGEPLASNRNAEGRRENRRTELVVLSK